MLKWRESVCFYVPMINGELQNVFTALRSYCGSKYTYKCQLDCTTCPAPGSKQRKITTSWGTQWSIKVPEMSFRSWWRPNLSWTKCKYVTWMGRNESLLFIPMLHQLNTGNCRSAKDNCNNAMFFLSVWTRVTCYFHLRFSHKWNCYFHSSLLSENIPSEKKHAQF